MEGTRKAKSVSSFRVLSQADGYAAIYHGRPYGTRAEALAFIEGKWGERVDHPDAVPDPQASGHFRVSDDTSVWIEEWI